MAVPIRPPVWPPAPTNIQPGKADARMVAQKAFFEAALAGKPAPPPIRPAAMASDPGSSAGGRAQPGAARVSSETAEPDHLPRPGSIIDIWV